MAKQRRSIQQLAVYAVVLLASTYSLTLGGTFNGAVDASLRQLSLGLLTLLVGGWLALVWFRPRSGSLWSNLWPALFAWVIVYSVALRTGPSVRVGTGVWHAGLYAGIWLLLVDLRYRGIPARWYLDALLFAALPIILVAYVQVIGWFPAWWGTKGVDIAFVAPRPSGTFGNPNAFGTFLAVVLPIGLMRAVHSNYAFSRAIWRLWSMAALLALYLSYSRGAWLAFGSGLLTLFLLSGQIPSWMSVSRWGRQRTSTKLLRVTLYTLGLLGILLIMTFYALQAFDTPRRDVGPRLNYYRAAWEVWKDNPLIGSGPFTFGLHLQQFISVPPEQPHSHAHSMLFTIAAEMGLLGVVALVVSIGLITVHRWTGHKQAKTPAARLKQAACTSSLVALGVHSLFDGTLMMPAIMLLGLLVLAACQDPGNNQRTPDALRDRHKVLFFNISMTVLWAGVLVVAWWAAQVYVEYIRGEKLLVNGHYRAGAEVLSRVVERQPRSALYWAEYGYACGLAAADEDLFCLDEGIQAYERALTHEPTNAIWWANLAALCWEQGTFEQALVAMNEAIQLAPDYPDFWLNLGVFFEKLERFDDASAAYQEVLYRDQQWGNARFWIETSLRQDVLAANPIEPTRLEQAKQLAEAGKMEEALALLHADIPGDRAQPGPYIRIARLHIWAGNLDQAQTYLRAARLLVHNDPDTAWVRLGEAELALARGDISSWESTMVVARSYLSPEPVGYPLLYGRDIAHFQFLHGKVQGMLLPQLTILGPYPQLRDLLWGTPPTFGR